MICNSAEGKQYINQEFTETMLKLANQANQMYNLETKEKIDFGDFCSINRFIKLSNELEEIFQKETEDNKKILKEDRDSIASLKERCFKIREDLGLNN